MLFAKAYSRLVTFPGQFEKNVNHHLEILAVLHAPAIVLFALLGRLWTLNLWRKVARAAADFFGASSRLRIPLLATGRHHPLLLWLGGITVTYAAVTWPLTPRWSALGVAAAFSLSQALLLPARCWIFRPICVRPRHKITFREISIAATFLFALSRTSSKSAVGMTGAIGIFWDGGLAQSRGGF
jgi:O-antigen/teichoic acid export membrane protein